MDPFVVLGAQICLGSLPLLILGIDRTVGECQIGIVRGIYLRNWVPYFGVCTPVRRQGLLFVYDLNTFTFLKLILTIDCIVLLTASI